MQAGQERGHGPQPRCRRGRPAGARSGSGMDGEGAGRRTAERGRDAGRLAQGHEAFRAKSWAGVNSGGAGGQGTGERQMKRLAHFSKLCLDGQRT